MPSGALLVATHTALFSLERSNPISSPLLSGFSPYIPVAWQATISHDRRVMPMVHAHLRVHARGRYPRCICWNDGIHTIYHMWMSVPRFSRQRVLLYCRTIYRSYYIYTIPLPLALVCVGLTRSCGPLVGWGLHSWLIKTHRGQPNTTKG